MQRLIILLVSMSLVLTSCTFIEKTKGTIADVFRTDEQKDAIRATEIRERIALLVNDGKYADALTLIGKEVKGGRPERSFGDLYVNSMNGLSQDAVMLKDAGDYGKAGIAFRQALVHMPTDGDLLSRIDYTSVELISFMNICSDRLMEKGIKEYRKGNLGNAIVIWQEILKYDPDHEEAAKAIDTATIQMDNLQKIEKN